MLLAALLVPQATLPPVRAASCYQRETRGGTIVPRYIGDRHCVAFGPPIVMQGIWLRAFEGSEFHEGAHERADIRTSDGVPWFNTDEPLKPFADPATIEHRYAGRLYLVRLVGRRSVVQDRPPMEGFGHMGGSPSLVLLDEMLSIEDLGPLRPAQ